MWYLCHVVCYYVITTTLFDATQKKNKKAWQPEVAGELLRKFDQSQGGPHRASVYFAGAGLGTLRADVEAHASGRGMSPRLRQAIVAYHLCMLDDIVAEVVHRDVSWQGRSVVASSMNWWASSVRIEQNLKLEASPFGRELIHKYWPKWKTPARPCDMKKRKRSSGNARIKTRLFLESVYRTAMAGLFDWSYLGGSVGLVVVEAKKIARTLAQILQTMREELFGVSCRTTRFPAFQCCK